MSALPVASFPELSLYGDVQKSFTTNSCGHRLDEISLNCWRGCAVIAEEIPGQCRFAPWQTIIPKLSVLTVPATM